MRTFIILILLSMPCLAIDDYKSFINDKGQIDPVYLNNAIRDLYNDFNAYKSSNSVMLNKFSDYTYIDNGDPSSNQDWTQAGMTQDGAWHDLACPVPSNSKPKAVSISVNIQDDVVGASVCFRRNGNLNEGIMNVLKTQVTNIEIEDTFTISCDINGVIEYKTGNLTYTKIRVKYNGCFK